MIKFKVNIDYKRKEEAVEKLSNSELTLDYITTAVATCYKDGLSGSKRRMFGRIQRKIEDAIDKNEDTIELEVAEFDFIRKTFDDDKATLPAHVSQYVNLLEDEIEATKDANKKKKETDTTAEKQGD